jgi:hypothetical protein
MRDGVYAPLMPIDTSQLAARLNEQIASLGRERDGHVAAIADIDTKINKALHALGLDASDFGEPRAAALPRLGPSPFAQAYPLNPNTMGAVMVEILRTADHGYSRVEMRKRLEQDDRFTTQIQKNVNGYYNTVNRYLKNRRVVDVGGLLYHPDRAPLAAGQDDPTGQHLPSNVSTLFPDKRANGDD